MNIQTIAALAASLIAVSAHAGSAPDKKCGAGSCSKKTSAQSEKGASTPHADKEASCSKKDASCSKKEASCSKKEASCAKKSAS